MKTYSVRKYNLAYVREPGLQNAISIQKSTDVSEFVRKYLSDLPIERVAVLALDGGNRITGYVSMDGDTNQCVVFPQSVFRFLLSAGASGFVLAHNHPGGTPDISSADWEITRRLHTIGKNINITLLDHIIIADETIISMRDNLQWPGN
jgi:DNA repair protein RadC